MRPPDENQNGSTRPNFMSASRRAYAGDDNILARLERDAKRGKSSRSGPWKHARLAWCLLASVLVIGLIGTLATLARENLTAPHKSTVAEAAPATTDAFASDVRSGFAPLPVPSPTRKLGANAFDAAPEPMLMPPMVMLKPAPAAATPKAAAPAPARAAAPKPAARAQPERIAAAVKPTPARPPARALAVTPRSVAAVPVTARTKKPAPAPAAAAPESAPVDSDVALLSAIIMHASRHSAERAQMEAARCGAGKKCVPTDIPSLKATD
ncbi:MAG: hypothetical protein JWQ01_535 [Massilia sp.]|nr:hypothetical protein [Massilia sp.]